MHHLSARRSRRSFVSAASCAVLVLAILSIAGAIAAPSRATTQASTERLCADASPGFMACFAERVTAPSGGVQPFAVPSGYGPADIQGAYKLSTSPGAG